MRVLIIGGTGFIGRHIVRQMADQRHELTIFQRGRTTAVVPGVVREVIDPNSTLPIIRFPEELFHPVPDVVIHTMAMGLADAKAAVQAFAGRAKRLVVLTSGDVYRCSPILVRKNSGRANRTDLQDPSRNRAAPAKSVWTRRQ